MTTGPEWKEILLFSLPIMAGQFLQQLYNTVDGVVVGRYGGATQAICENMIAAVGSCVSLIFLFLAISIGLGNGGAVLVAQLYGARRTHELRRAASTLLITLVGLGTFLTVAGSVFAKPLVVGLMRVRDPDIVDMAIEYFAIYSLGLIFQYVYNAVAGILRAIGDSRATMYFLIVSAVLNTILDVWFVVSFGWGVVGVAVATVIAQAASAAVSVAYMFIKYPIFRFKKGEFVFDREKFAISLKLGVPAIIQQAVISLGNVFIQRLVNSFDSTTMSAFTVGNRMEAYALVPIFGFNSGVATFTGQNVGAQKYDRARKGARFGIISAVVLAELIGVLYYIFAPALIGIFDDNPGVIAYGVQQARTAALFYFLLAFSHSVAAVCRGSGKAFVPMLIMFSVWCVLRVAYIAVVMRLFGEIGYIYWAYPITWAISSVIYLFYFLFSDWIHGFDPKAPKAKKA